MSMIDPHRLKCWQAVQDSKNQTQVKEAEEAFEIAAAKGDPEEKDQEAVENEDAETDFDDELAEVKLRWRQAAKEKVKTYVQLQVRPTNSSQDMMREMMVQSTALKTQADAGQFHLHVYDAKTEGESKTQPMLRMPVNRPAYMISAVGAAFRARCPDYVDDDGVYLTEDSLYMFFDAYKHDLQASFEKCFNIPDKKIQKTKKLLYIAYEESTLLRRTRVRVHNTDMEAVEQCAIICGKQFTLNGKRRLIGENSSNLFNILSGVASEDPTDEKEEWCLPVATKREVLGDTRKESGGGCALSSAGIKQSIMDKEPVSWHGNSCLFWREICSSYHACSLVDLTPQNDNAALACIMAKIPYFAITNNETHMALLTERLQERVFQEFQNPDSPLYEPVCVADFDVAC